MTWKHLAAGATLIAVAVAVYVFATRPPDAVSVTPAQTIEPVTPDPEAIAFGLDPAPRNLTLRSKVGEVVHWSVRTGSRFEIAPEAGTITPLGSTIVRVRPRSGSLTNGLNAEHTWFTWTTANGPQQQLLVRLTALRPPEVDYILREGNREIVLMLNGTEVGRTRRTNEAHTVFGKYALHAGDNTFEVRAADSGPRAHYELWLRVGSREMTVTESTPMPVIVTLDPDLGFISLAASASPP